MYRHLLAKKIAVHLAYGILSIGLAISCGYAAASDFVAGQKSAARFNHGIFWSISKDGEVVGHIFGTFHSNDKRILNISDKVREALHEAQSFSMENFPGSRYFNPHWGFRSIIRDMTLPDGKTLASLIGENVYQQATQILADNGVKEERIRYLYPWAVMNELSVRKIISTEENPGKILDHQLFDMAHNKELYQVENLEELMAAYDDFPIDAQIALLNDRIANYHRLSLISEQMVIAYLDEDLSMLLDLSTQFISDDSSRRGYDVIYLKNVLHERNYVMAHHMLAPLRRKKAFITVGALHLTGEVGVLRQLENYGYTVNRVLLGT